VPGEVEQRLTEGGFAKPSTTAHLLDEADQLTRIFVASINTARKGKRRRKNPNEEPEL